MSGMNTKGAINGMKSLFSGFLVITAVVSTLGFSQANAAANSKLAPSTHQFPAGQVSSSQGDGIQGATRRDAKARTHVTAEGSSSIARIKQYYAKEKMRIADISYPLSGYALVAWVYKEPIPNLPTRYDLWDMTTASKFYLPTGEWYVKLLQTKSSTDIQFLATGTNDIDAFVRFPFLLDCVRGDTKSQFQEFDEPYYLQVTQPVTFGDPKTEAISSVRTTMDGIQVAFAAIKGKYSDFEAGSTGIPPTSTHYSPSTNQFTILFRNTQIYWHGNPGSNFFVRNVTLKQVGQNSEVVVNLTAQAKYYLANQHDIIPNNYQPYVTFVFNSENPPVYAGFYAGE